MIELLGPYLRKILNTSPGEKWFVEEAYTLLTKEFLDAVNVQRDSRAAIMCMAERTAQLYTPTGLELTDGHVLERNSQRV